MEHKVLYRTGVIVLNIVRFVVAGVFIFSGLVKANDPWGTCHKIEEYLHVFGFGNDYATLLPIVATVALATIEFLIGVFLLFGIYRRFTAVALLLFMVVVTPLTLYIAIANPVSDCGCFGEVIPLSNWATFTKNIVLLAAAIAFFKWSARLFRLISLPSQEYIIGFATLYIVVLAIYCYHYLPFFDVTPYRVGNNLIEQMAIPEGEKLPVYEERYVMEKGGEQQVFTLEEYPDSTWTFVSAEILVKERGYEPPISNFTVYDVETGDEVSGEILEHQGYTFILVAPRLTLADDKYADIINEIYDYSVDYGYPFYALTCSTDDEMEQWRYQTGAEYPFCVADDTTLNTIVRANPGLVLLRDAVVVNKWSTHNIPAADQFCAPLEQLSLGQQEGQLQRKQSVAAILWIVIPLLLITLIDSIVTYRHKKRNKHTD